MERFEVAPGTSQNPLRIMHLLKHSMRDNGNVHVAVDLACRQAEAGDTVHFVSGQGSFDSLLAHYGVQVHARKSFARKLGGPLALCQLFLLIARYRPHLVHAHMMSSAIFAWVVTRVLRVQLITTVHNSFDSHSSFMRLGDAIIAVSKSERLKLISRGFPPQRVRVVLNGAGDSPRELDIAESHPQLHHPCIVSISGLHGRKAVGDIIEAFSTARSLNPSWHLEIFGSGPDEETLKQLVSSIGEAAHIHFRGPIRTSHHVLSNADLFVSASLQDPCPLTVTEARWAGCAIVATAVDGVPEILDYGRAGVLVPAGNTSELAKALTTVMSNRLLSEQWRSASSQSNERFSTRRVTADHRDVYLWALQRRFRSTRRKS